ncbi:hypothetical protein GINT2_000346 [Glugoides intestinalis]
MRRSTRNRTICITKEDLEGIIFPANQKAVEETTRNSIDMERMQNLTELEASLVEKLDEYFAVKFPDTDTSFLRKTALSNVLALQPVVNEVICSQELETENLINNNEMNNNEIKNIEVLEENLIEKEIPVTKVVMKEAVISSEDTNKHIQSEANALYRKNEIPQQLDLEGSKKELATIFKSSIQDKEKISEERVFIPERTHNFSYLLELWK